MAMGRGCLIGLPPSVSCSFLAPSPPPASPCFLISVDIATSVLAMLLPVYS